MMGWMAALLGAVLIFFGISGMTERDVASNVWGAGLADTGITTLIGGFVLIGLGTLIERFDDLLRGLNKTMPAPRD